MQSTTQPPARIDTTETPVVAFSLRLAALDTLRHYIGAYEKPRGSNSDNGGVITQSNILATGVDGVPWCAAIVYRSYDAAARAANIQNPLPRTGSVSKMFAVASQKLSGLAVVASKKMPPPEVPIGTIFGRGRRGRKLVIGNIAPAHTGVIAGVTIGSQSASTVEGNYLDALRSSSRTFGEIEYYIFTE